MSDTYVVAATGAWNRKIFDECLSSAPGRWVFVSAPSELDAARLQSLAPRFIFFLHWSWKVPAAVYQAYECVGFHMTDLPYGRGGTPLQNLILRGHQSTKLSAFRVQEAMDAGPVYAKAPLSLDGRAQEIYERASRLAVQMMQRIAAERPTPVPQTGEVVLFERRNPDQSRLPVPATVKQLYDFIRMLDAEGYPHAFVQLGATRVELTGARLERGALLATARFVSLEPARDA